jgi:hypothetical protein
VPSLVGVLARYVDVGLLVSQMPKRKMDAKVYYRDGNGNGNGNGRGSKKLRGVEMGEGWRVGSVMNAVVKKDREYS